MKCNCCAYAREYHEHGRMFNSLACVYCAARLMQKIDTFKISDEKKRLRKNEAFLDSAKVGLDKKLIMDLYRGSMALEPEIQKGKRA